VGTERARTATWTAAQSGTASANVYLQADPTSLAANSPTLTAEVTYLATAGQSFQVQYGTPSDPYHPSETVTSPGTGDWRTATVRLTDAQFNEAQNLGADLRIAAGDPSKPLSVSQVTLTAEPASGTSGTGG
jgi:hypothetical protein